MNVQATKNEEGVGMPLPSETPLNGISKENYTEDQYEEETVSGEEQVTSSRNTEKLKNSGLLTLILAHSPWMKRDINGGTCSSRSNKSDTPTPRHDPELNDQCPIVKSIFSIKTNQVKQIIVESDWELFTL